MGESPCPLNWVFMTLEFISNQCVCFNIQTSYYSTAARWDMAMAHWAMWQNKDISIFSPFPLLKRAILNLAWKDHGVSLLSFGDETIMLSTSLLPLSSGVLSTSSVAWCHPQSQSIIPVSPPSSWQPWGSSPIQSIADNLGSKENSLRIVPMTVNAKLFVPLLYNPCLWR